MKKLKRILLLGLITIGAVSFAGCGGVSNTPEDVANKFLENSLKKDVRNDETKKETLALIHSKVSNKDDAIEAAASLNDMFESLRQQFKQYGVESTFDEFLKVTLDGIKITKVDEKIDGDKATLKYEVSVPNIDQSKFQETVTKLTTDKLKNIKDGKFDEKALMKDVMNEALKIAIEEIKKGGILEKESLEVELEKDGNKWAITSTY